MPSNLIIDSGAPGIHQVITSVQGRTVSVLACALTKLAEVSPANLPSIQQLLGRVRRYAVILPAPNQEQARNLALAYIDESISPPIYNNPSNLACGCVVLSGRVIFTDPQRIMFGSNVRQGRAHFGLPSDAMLVIPGRPTDVPSEMLAFAALQTYVAVLHDQPDLAPAYHRRALQLPAPMGAHESSVTTCAHRGSLRFGEYNNHYANLGHSTCRALSGTSARRTPRAPRHLDRHYPTQTRLLATPRNQALGRETSRAARPARATRSRNDRPGLPSRLAARPQAGHRRRYPVRIRRPYRPPIRSAPPQTLRLLQAQIDKSRLNMLKST